MEYTFDSVGVYTVTLDVERCRVGFNYHHETKEVEILPPPVITLTDDVTTCSGTPVTLTAIEGYDESEGLYKFEWTNAAGQVFGDSTSNSIVVDEESIYTVTVSYQVPEGEDPATYETCAVSSSVFVGPAFDFELNHSSEESCYEENRVTFAPNTPVSGDWAYQLQGDDAAPTPVGEGFEYELNVSNLPGPGIYEIIFTTEDPILEDCIVEKRVELIVNPLPEFTITAITPAADCNSQDGSFEISMISDADSVIVVETGTTFLNVVQGETLPTIDNLDPGIYTVRARLGSCAFIKTVSISNSNPPNNFDPSVEVTPETCGPEGTLNGSMDIAFSDPSQVGNYVLTREEDGIQLMGTFTGDITLSLSSGNYAVELSDENNCAVPFDSLFTIGGKSRVQFTHPSHWL